MNYVKYNIVKTEIYLEFIIANRETSIIVLRERITQYNSSSQVKVVPSNKHFVGNKNRYSMTVN